MVRRVENPLGGANAAEHAVADYAAAHQLLSMQEWLEFYRLQQTVNDIHSRRDELTERYKASQ